MRLWSMAAVWLEQSEWGVRRRRWGSGERHAGPMFLHLILQAALNPGGVVMSLRQETEAGRMESTCSRYWW